MRSLSYTPPSWLTSINASVFLVMTSVSILQNTIFLRNLTLVVGALIGCYVIYQNCQIFNLKNAYPLIALILLFVWVLAHYFFLAGDPPAQLNELSSIWKRVFLTFLFAVGLGLSVRGSSKINRNLIILGFAATVIVFYMRWGINFFGLSAGYPFLVQNYFDPGSIGYISKYSFSTFVIPFVALVYYFLFKTISGQEKHRIVLIALAGLSLIASLYILYAVQNKNGILYFLVISFVFLLYLILRQHNKLSFRAYLVLSFFILSLSPLIYSHIKSQSTWETFVMDAQVALDFEHHDHWKYSGAKGYPNNELGKTVSITAYERVAWAVKGAELVVLNPQGYGLVINSFGPLAKTKWPDSRLTHSHSGWLDIALAFGIPGISLILIALFGAVMRCSQQSSFIPKAGIWMLLAIFLVFTTSEVAERVLLDYLIFLIAFFSASTINAD